MTRKEFIEKYGDVVVTFSSYYKYSFTYVGKLADGSMIACSVGGCHDDIYRMDVNTNPITIANLEPYSGTVTSNGQLVDDFYDF